MTKTTTLVVVGGNTITSDVKHLEVLPQLGAAGQFIIDVDNQGGTYNAAFNVNDVVDIDIGGIDVMVGWVDSVKPYVDDDPDIFRQVLRIMGRDYTRELSDKTVDKYYTDQPADDIVDDLLSTASAGIPYTTANAGTTMSYDSKDNYLLNSIRDIADRDGNDWYVDTSRVLQYFAKGANSSGITLKSGADTAHNILSLDRETDGLDVGNYVIIRGKDVDDGWTELNASDFSKPTSGTVSDDTVNVTAGISSIRFVKGAASASWIELDFTGTLYGRTNLDWRWLTGGEMKYKFMASTSFGYVNADIRLTDSHGNVIRVKDDAVPDIVSWKDKSYSLGTDVKIAPITELSNRIWTYLSTASDIDFAGSYTSLDIDADDGNGRAVLTADGGTPFSGLSIGDKLRLKSAEDATNESWYAGNKVIYSVTNTVITLTSTLSSDNAADTSMSIGRLFNWNVTKIRWNAPNATGFQIDGLSLPAKLFSVAQDATSQSAYGVRHVIQHKKDLESQVELDRLSAALLAQRKDPIELIDITAIGTTGVSGVTNKWLPGYTVTVNVPGEGINNVSYRMVKIRHTWDDERRLNGYDWWTDVTLMKTTDTVDQKRLDALKNEYAVIQEIRERLRYLEQEEDSLDVGYPPLPGALEEYHMLSMRQWKQSWEVEKTPMTIVSGEDGVAAGTNTVSDTSASQLVAAKRLTSASSGRMFGTLYAVSPPAGGTYSFGIYAKVTSNSSTATVLQLQIYSELDSGNRGTLNITPSLFSSSGKYEFFYIRVNCDPADGYRIRGQFTTGITDFYVDWAAVTDNPVPYAASGAAVNAAASGLNNLSSASDLSNLSSASELDNVTGPTSMDNVAEAAHLHSLSNTAGYVVTGSRADRYCLTASGSSTARYALGDNVTSTFWAATASGGAVTTQYKTMSLGTDLQQFRAIPTGTSIDAVVGTNEAITLSAGTNVATGTATITGGAHNHAHGTDTHNHSHGSDSHNHSHGSDSHNHSHGTDSHGHTTTEGTGHKH